MINYHLLQFVFFLLCLVQRTSFASRPLPESVKNAPSNDGSVVYHKGALLHGNISVNLIWYGTFKPSQRAIVSDFIASLSPSSSASPSSQAQPSVASWWSTIANYYAASGTKATTNTSPALSLFLGEQLTDEACSQGKSLTDSQVVELASRAEQTHAINVLLTSPDVSVEGFCSSRCGSHGSKRVPANGAARRLAHIWVGNSETQCRGYCAWPFHRSIYGPQTDPLTPPNGDVGMDGLVISLASLLAGTVTNPFGNGFFQGSPEAPLEAASACPGVFGSGAFPGYTGKLLTDSETGGSYNANGAQGRKYLLPALYDPLTASCSTLV